MRVRNEPEILRLIAGCLVIAVARHCGGQLAANQMAHFTERFALAVGVLAEEARHSRYRVRA